MSTSPEYKSIAAALLFTFVLLLLPSAPQAADSLYTLPNGMKVILKENHGSPMIASVVFVKSGSKYESQYENGITHFLEHLLFDGTTHLDRTQLDESIRNLGGYINAFTRKELTAYLVLMPRQYIDYGLAVQTDMLFNSTIPESELPKERKVVIEEINRDADAPNAAADAFFTSKAYAGTDYGRPVLGYRAFIDNIPREAIVDYWKRYYEPRNMTALIIGDFDTPEMKAIIRATLGSITPPADSGQSGASVPGGSTVQGDVLTGQHVYDTVANVKSTYIDFSFTAPKFSDSDYLAIDLLSQYLNMSGVSPLTTALTGGTDPLASEASVSLAAYEEFSRLEVNVVTDKADKAKEIVSTIISQIENIDSHMADRESIEGIKTSVKAQDVYNAEKLHYYGFMIAPMMMTAGWEFIQSYPARLAQVTWSDCQTAARHWLKQPDYVAVVVRPVTDSTQVPYIPPQPTDEQIKTHFDSVTFRQYDLSSGYPLAFPSTDSVKFVLADNATYDREVLPNGLTVIIKHNPDSRVFAMNVLGKDRSANEPAGQTGITDFVNRCIERGTVTRDANQLSRELSQIGANVTLYDNPWIPYDDRYTTGQYSFMKFETIDDFAERGFYLFSEMVLQPAFDSAEVENVRSGMLGTLGRDATTPSKVARDLFFKTLFDTTAYARPIMGTPQTIGAITVADLKNYHAMFYAPQNMILTIASHRPIDEVKRWVRNQFARLCYPADTYHQAVRPEPILQTKTAHADLNKEQINIYIGSLLPGANDGDAAALEIAASILSQRLYQNLRERDGLAYSVGTGATFDKNFGWYYSTIGTASGNFEKAKSGIILQIEKLQLDGPSAEEINSARNQIWGRLMSAKLSSINQAYYLGVDEYLGRQLGYDKEYLQALQAANSQDIRRVTSKYFRTDAYVMASAGKM